MVQMPNQAAIAQKQAIAGALQAKARDAALGRKALVAEQAQDDLFTDDISGDVYKCFPATLTEANFTVASSTLNSETTIMSYQVPNGIEYLFRSPKSSQDRNSPYLYGAIGETTTCVTTLMVGYLRIKIKDASKNDLKGQPFAGAVSQLDSADPIDWNKRLFFNCRKPIRAKAGDYIEVTLDAAKQWSKTTSTIVIQVLQLTKVG